MISDLIDIGLNLTHKQFRTDLDEVIQRAKQAGVGKMVLTGTSERGSDDALALAIEHPGLLYSTAGVHPHTARNCTESTIPHLRSLAEKEEVVAIGECGLDYNRDFSPRPEQVRWFEAQVELAAELDMPLFLHERDAHEHFLEILSRHRDDYPAAVVHCFTGTGEELDAYLALDLHIGITGWICDERRGTHLRDIVDRIPENRLMIETDAPFLIPRDLRPRPKSRRNEPSFLPHILETVATAVDRSPEKVAEQTTATARDFFGLAS